MKTNTLSFFTIIDKNLTKYKLCYMLGDYTIEINSWHVIEIR